MSTLLWFTISVKFKCDFFYSRRPEFPSWSALKREAGWSRGRRWVAPERASFKNRPTTWTTWESASKASKSGRTKSEKFHLLIHNKLVGWWFICLKDSQFLDKFLFSYFHAWLLCSLLVFQRDCLYSIYFYFCCLYVRYQSFIKCSTKLI